MPLANFIQGIADDVMRDVIEYARNSDLRDFERLPLLKRGGIEQFIEREAPHSAPDA